MKQCIDLLDFLVDRHETRNIFRNSSPTSPLNSTFDASGKTESMGIIQKFRPSVSSSTDQSKCLYPKMGPRL